MVKESVLERAELIVHTIIQQVWLKSLHWKEVQGKLVVHTIILCALAIDRKLAAFPASSSRYD